VVTSSDCTIDRGLGVSERMSLLAAAHARGGGHVTMELARRVGGSGRVVGIDLDEELLQMARAEAAAQGLDNVTFRAGPVEQFSDADLDVTFARALLSHLRDPAELVRRMAGVVRPGGMSSSRTCTLQDASPNHRGAAYDRWVAWFKEAVRRTAGDLDIGPAFRASCARPASPGSGCG
jgi:ubiquinone/menaquinone biosynthesis C-methylase UbiE